MSSSLSGRTLNVFAFSAASDKGGGGDAAQLTLWRTARPGWHLGRVPAAEDSARLVQEQRLCEGRHGMPRWQAMAFQLPARAFRHTPLPVGAHNRPGW